MDDPLIDHRYTVLEIERMRLAVTSLLTPIIWQNSTFGYCASGPNFPGETERRVELQLRTYMMAGTRPEDLETLVRERHAESEQQRQQFLAEQT